MNSLSAHLTAGPDHGRLRFHPDCPVCRSQRLFGALHDSVLPARTKAGLLVAALGAGSLLPAAGAVAAPDVPKPSAAQVGETPTPVLAPVPDGAQPEADETQEAPMDEAPELRELVTNPDLGTDSGGEDVTGEDESPGTAPLAPTPVDPPPPEQPIVTPPPPAPPPTPAQPAPVELPSPPPIQLEQPTSDNAPKKLSKRKAPKRAAEARERARQHVAELPAAAPPVSPAVTEAAASPPTEAVTVSQAAAPAESPVTGPSYTVRTGDSLWSIARRVLGPQASAGRIAREVNRLWELNQERIATGNPSLVHVGTVLRLR